MLFAVYLDKQFLDHSTFFIVRFFTQKKVLRLFYLGLLFLAKKLLKTGFNLRIVDLNACEYWICNLLDLKDKIVEYIFRK